MCVCVSACFGLHGLCLWCCLSVVCCAMCVWVRVHMCVLMYVFEYEPRALLLKFCAITIENSNKTTAREIHIQVLKSTFLFSLCFLNKNRDAGKQPINNTIK